MTEERLNRIIQEELTKSEVNGMISSKLSSHVKSRDFEKAVKEISANVLNKFMETLWQKKSFWINSIK